MHIKLPLVIRDSVVVDSQQIGGFGQETLPKNNIHRAHIVKSNGLLCMPYAYIFFSKHFGNSCSCRRL